MTAAQEADFNDPQRGEFQPGAIGRLLRETREGYRQDLATVSQQLRIRSVYLKAIEDGNYQDLPGSAYAVGFVRTYAEYLGLDPQEIVRRFRDEADEVNRRTRLVFPVPTVEAKVPSGALILVALIVAALAYGGWYYLSDRDRSLVDLVPALPDSLRELIEPSDETDSAESQITESQVDETPVPSVATASESEPADGVAQDGVALGDDAQDAQDMSAATLSEPLLPVEESTGTDPAPDATSVGSTAESETTDDAAVVTTDPATEAAATIAETSSLSEEAMAAAEPDATEPATIEPAPETATTESTTGEAATSEVATEPAAPAAATTEPAASATGALAPLPEVEVAAIPEAPRVPSSVQDGQSFGVAFGGSRVVIVARMESWLQVSDADGNPIWARVLRAGDRYLVPEQEGLVLSVGNAGGIDVFVDGSKAPSLGAVGVGRRGISLDPDRLRSGTALP